METMFFQEKKRHPELIEVVIKKVSAQSVVARGREEGKLRIFLQKSIFEKNAKQRRTPFFRYFEFFISPRIVINYCTCKAVRGIYC
jgi:hypothetical protein